MVGRGRRQIQPADGEITDLDKSIERHQKVLDLEAEQRIENRDPKKGGKRDTKICSARSASSTPGCGAVRRA